MKAHGADAGDEPLGVGVPKAAAGAPDRTPAGDAAGPPPSSRAEACGARRSGRRSAGAGPHGRPSALRGASAACGPTRRRRAPTEAHTHGTHSRGSGSGAPGASACVLTQRTLHYFSNVSKWSTEACGQGRVASDGDTGYRGGAGFQSSAGEHAPTLRHPGEGRGPVVQPSPARASAPSLTQRRQTSPASMGSSPRSVAASTPVATPSAPFPAGSRWPWWGALHTKRAGARHTAARSLGLRRSCDARRAAPV